MLQTGQVAEEQHIVDYLWREECHFKREQGWSRSCDTVYMQTGEVRCDYFFQGSGLNVQRPLF